MERRTGARRRRHMCFEEHRTLYVQARSREAGRPAREGPLYRGRGEAAGDYGGTVEHVRTATVDRTIILPSPGLEAPARFFEKYRTGKWGENPEISYHERPIDRLGESRILAELL